jgi:hypothetical protein
VLAVRSKRRKNLHRARLNFTNYFCVDDTDRSKKFLFIESNGYIMKRVRTSSSCGRDVTVQSTSSSLLQRLPHECIDHVRTYLCLGCLAHMALASSHLHGASIAYLRLAVCVETCAIQCCASRIQPSTNIGLGVRLLERYARQLEQLIIRASYRQTGRASDTAVYWDAIARVIAHCSATLRVVSVHIYTDAIFAALAQCSNLRTLPFIDLPNSAVSLSSDLLLRVIRNSRSLTTASLSSNMGYNLKVYQALLQSGTFSSLGNPTHTHTHTHTHVRARTRRHTQPQTYHHVPKNGRLNVERNCLPYVACELYVWVVRGMRF